MNFLLIDAFAERAFTGNPAAVVWIDGDWPDDDRLAKLAMEFNQAETAYVRHREDGRFDLRWFTPAREVELCGHATLASAKALIEWNKADEQIRFVTRWSGELINREFAEIRWVVPTELPDYDILEGNVDICRRLAGEW